MDRLFVLRTLRHVIDSFEGVDNGFSGEEIDCLCELLADLAEGVVDEVRVVTFH